MEDIGILYYFLALIAILFIYFVLLFWDDVTDIFYSGKVRRIRVVKKWSSFHKGLSQMTSRTVVSQHALIDVKYPESKRPDKIHTLDCKTGMLYSSLSVGKEYTVTIKFFQIVKIHKKRKENDRNGSNRNGKRKKN